MDSWHFLFVLVIMDSGVRSDVRKFTDDTKWVAMNKTITVKVLRVRILLAA